MIGHISKHLEVHHFQQQKKKKKKKKTLFSVFANAVKHGLSCLTHNISNTRDSVSSGYPNTEKRVENTTRSGVFLTKFEVFG